MLIELCKNKTIIIVNGIFQHVWSSHLTFRNTSVLNYYIASTTKAYKLIEHFEIKSLDSLYSDGHSVLSCSIKINTNNRQPANKLKTVNQKVSVIQPIQTDSSKTSMLKKLNNYYKLLKIIHHR